MRDRVTKREAKPVTLERYLLIDRCGEGSSGSVFRAYDPRLDRKVAIKLMREPKGSKDEAGVLHREARAIAQISHPNVVGVFDSGTYSGLDLGHLADAASGREVPSQGVFVVMEYIEGQSLRDWLYARQREPREVLSAFLDAGRGLAAAHAAGVVHRDFKPDNVMVSDAGRVCVLDFGLAAKGSAQAARRIVGTPMYMSPEQHRGDELTPTSDQYSFGVSVYEALTGRPPFSGSLADICETKHGDAWLVGLDERLPPELGPALRRCVALDPLTRFSSMDELLRVFAEAIADEPRAKMRRALVVGALALAAAGLVFAWQRTTAASARLCELGEQHVESVWSEARRSKVERQLETQAAQYASASAGVVLRELDSYTDQWSEQYRGACEASLARDDKSEALFVRRVACLERRLHEVDVLVDTLLEADSVVLENAVSAVKALGWLEVCEDPDRFELDEVMPRDPHTRAEIQRGRARLAEAKILIAAGRYELALSRIMDVERSAQPLGYRPLEAEAGLMHARALMGRGDFEAARTALIAALATAMATADDRLLAEVLLALAWVVGAELEHADGEMWLALAEAALERIDAAPRLQSELLNCRAGVAFGRGDSANAVAFYEQALGSQRAVYGDEHPLVAQTLNHLANAYMQHGSPAQAFTYAERSLELRRALLGEAHPLVVACYNNMAAIRGMQGRHDEGLELIERARRHIAGAKTRREFDTYSIALTLHHERGDALGELAQLDALLALPDNVYPVQLSRAQFEQRRAHLLEAID